jgi:Na+/phosphate symporter
MSNDELIRCVEDAIAILENYRSFGPMVEDGIAAFEKINKCIKEPTPEDVAEAKRAISEMQRQIGPYKSMVPQISLTLDKLSEWSKEIDLK